MKPYTPYYGVRRGGGAYNTWYNVPQHVGTIPLVTVGKGVPIMVGIVYPHVEDTIPLVILGEQRTYNVWYIVLPHVRGAIFLVIVREGMNYNAWYNVLPHVGVAIPLVIMGEGGTYNTWYSVFPHVEGAIPFVTVGEGKTYNAWYGAPTPHEGGVITLFILGKGGFIMVGITSPTCVSYKCYIFSL